MRPIPNKNLAFDVVLDLEGWYANTATPIPSGQNTTQRYVTLQGSQATGGGSWVTYQYRNGSTGSFSNVPTTDVSPAPAGGAWPEQVSGSSFPAHTWDLQATLGLTNALVQVIACYGASATDPNLVCSMPTNLAFSPSTFGYNNATTQVGPGNLSLITGDYEIDATDAAASTSLGGLSIGRSLTSLNPAPATTGASGVFGPGWSANLIGPDAGDANLTVTDQASAGYDAFTAPDGGVSMYQATTPVSTYPITFTGAADAAGDGIVVQKTNASTITMAEQDGTITTWANTSNGWEVTSVKQPGSGATTGYTYNSAGLVTRILGTVPSGVSCATPDTTPGCRSLVLNYTTIASAQRLTSVSLSIPQANGVVNAIAVAQYDYSTGGQLLDAYDPRISPALKTAYTYNAQGRLATLTPPGQAAWSFAYNTAGQLSTISRPDPSGSTATTTIVYSVPLSGSGLPDLTAATVGTWAETSDLPLTGTAVFPATHVPAGTTASTVSSSDWPYAAVDYLDINGRQVNTAAYGAGAWQIDTTQYDSNGNDIWDLSAGNRAQALNPTASTDPYVAAQNNITAANLLASTTVYNPLDPSQITDTYGPTHPVTLSTGATIDARTHVATTYDEGAPNSDVNPATGGAYDLPTTVVTDPYDVQAGVDAAYPDAQTTHTGYNPVITGDPSGWDLGAPTSSTVQMGASPSSADLVTYTRYDASGRSVETRLPGDAAGTGPRTTDTTYYTPTGSGSCVSITLAGLVCQTAPAGQPATGAPLPTISYSYDQYGNQLTKTETYGTTGTIRTTTNTYDSAGRLATSSITVTPTAAGGTALPTVTYGYDPSTGAQTTVQTGTGPGIQTLTTGFNNIGEVTSYTDATGATTTTGYDLAGHPLTVNNGKNTVTYTYDNSTEHRGLVTAEDIGAGGQPSTFNASYGAAGNLTTTTYPNGLTASTSYDNAGNPTVLTYAKSGVTWMGFTQTVGAVSGQDGTVAQSSPQSSQTLAYDPDGRLIDVNDTYGVACTTRQYTFDTDSNRTSLTSYPAASGGTCSTSAAPTTTTYTYDAADRLTSDTAGAYTYDALGRTATAPAGDAIGIGAYAATTGSLTVAYYANDMVQSQQQGSTTDAFTLDPLQNRIVGQTQSSITTTNHYANSSDSPSWTSTSTNWTSNIAGPDGNFAATLGDNGAVVLQLANLHGDIVATAADDTAATAITNYSESTEYGAPRTPSTAYTTYGWLGGAQRSGNDLAGLTLMGVRLYNSATGRFESADPVDGGNANAYIYPDDPMSNSDTTGQHGDPYYLCFGRGYAMQGPFFHTVKCQNWLHESQKDFEESLSGGPSSGAPLVKEIENDVKYHLSWRGISGMIASWGFGLGCAAVITVATEGWGELAAKSGCTALKYAVKYGWKKMTQR